MESYIIIASNGSEIIDATPEAINRIAAIEYMEKKKKEIIKQKL